MNSSSPWRILNEPPSTELSSYSKLLFLVGLISIGPYIQLLKSHVSIQLAYFPWPSFPHVTLGERGRSMRFCPHIWLWSENTPGPKKVASVSDSDSHHYRSSSSPCWILLLSQFQVFSCCLISSLFYIYQVIMTLLSPSDMLAIQHSIHHLQTPKPLMPKRLRECGMR